MYINYFKTIIKGLIALFILFAPLQATYSFTFTVDIPDDFPDATPGDGVCNIGTNQCTLRAAIQEANAWPGTDYIILPAETYTFTQTGNSENSAATGDLDITENLVLTGEGAASTIIDGDRGGLGNAADRIFHILSGATVTISDVTIQNGSVSGQSGGSGGGVLNAGALTIINSTVSSNDASLSGGGVHNDGGILTILRSSISNNTKSGSSGANLGGGIGDLNGTTSITDSTVSGNTAFGSGGGINTTNGHITITNSTISSNAATGQTGGGLSNSGTMTVINSVVNGNSALNGGGYYSTGQATATITNSTFSGNTADVDGGGLYNHTTLTLIHSTVTNNNSTTGLGDGLYTDHGGSTNSATTTISHTLIAGNDPGTGSDCGTRSGDSLVSQGYNRDSDGTCTLSGTGDATDTVANLNMGILSNNGGLTRTHALGTGSTALNIIPIADCPPPDDDQRGADRPDGGVGTNCDTGAFERVTTEATAIDLRVTIDDTPDPIILGSGNLTYTIMVTNLGPNPATNVTLVDTLPGSVTYVSDTGTCAVAANVTCTIGALAVNGTASIDIVVTPTSIGTITNSATASATETDLNTTNNTSITEDTLVVATTDLSVDKIRTAPGTPEPILVTEDITYQITVTNNGAAATDGIKLIDTLPAGSTLVSATGTSGTWTCTGTSTITCDLSNTLAAAGTAVVEVVMSPPPAGGIITNTAYVTFNGFDPDTSNNISSLDTDTIAVSEMSVDIIESNDPTIIGANYTYQFNIINNGPSTANNVVLTVTLPASLTLNATGGSAGWVCSGTTTVTCNLSSLDADTNTVVVFTVNPTVAAPSSAPLTITASISSDAFDPNSANNSATEQTVVNDPTTSIDNADITLVSLLDTPDPVVANSNLIYTVNLRNNGPDTAQNVVLTLILPSSVTFVSSDAVCTVTTVGSTLRISCVIGSMALNSTAVANITVTPTLGDIIISAIASVTNTTGSDPNVTNNDNTKTQNTQVTPDTSTTTPPPGTSSGGGCFIATAAYGSYLDPHVMVLRKFRDNYLLTNSFGTQLVKFYYATSPPIADFIAQHEALRAMTRWALTPLVFGVEYPLGTTLLGILLIGGISYRRTRSAV